MPLFRHKSKQAAAAAETIAVDGVGDVRVVQSARARRLSLSVNAAGGVRLTYPRGVSRAKALEFLNARLEWVAAAKARQAECAAARPRTEYTPEQTAAMRREAHEDLPQRTAAIAARTGLKYGRLTIRAARS